MQLFEFWSILTCQYSEAKSRVVNHSDSPKRSRMSLTLGTGQNSVTVILFSLRKSTHNLFDPSFLGTKIMGKDHGELDGSIILHSSKVSISFFKNSRSARDNLYGGIKIGGLSMVLITHEPKLHSLRSLILVAKIFIVPLKISLNKAV